jgi:hypothetical protein
LEGGIVQSFAKPRRPLACLLSRGFRDSGESLIGDLFHSIRKWQQHLATCRELDASSAAIKEGNADFVFERLHLLCDRRLR